MSMELQDAIRKIKKLCNQTVENSCTEAEAMNAAKMAGNLMELYNVSMDQVFLDAQTCVTLRVPTGRKSRHPVDRCITSISNFCDCKVWFSRSLTDRNVSDYCFFGLPTDTEMAKYLYEIVIGSIERETIDFKTTEEYEKAKDRSGYDVGRKTMTTSFQRGMAGRIAGRLQEMLHARHTTEGIRKLKAPDGTCTSIVLLKKSKVEDEHGKLGMKWTKNYYSGRIGHREAFGMGEDAGDRVNLQRPLTRNSQQKMLV